jgi:hypothetical protein
MPRSLSSSCAEEETAGKKSSSKSLSEKTRSSIVTHLNSSSFGLQIQQNHSKHIQKSKERNNFPKEETSETSSSKSQRQREAEIHKTSRSSKKNNPTKEETVETTFNKESETKR